MNRNRHYLWLDLETTGLDPDKCSVIEFACVLTDSDLNEKFEYHAYLKSMIEDWDEEAREMHRNSGLLEVRSDLDLKDCKTSVYISEYVCQELERFNEPVWLAGVGPHFDRRFLRRSFPKLDDRLHYRHFDARTIFALLQDADSIDFNEKRTRDHRAMTDVKQTLKNIREVNKRIEHGRL